VPAASASRQTHSTNPFTAGNAVGAETPQEGADSSLCSSRCRWSGRPASWWTRAPALGAAPRPRPGRRRSLRRGRARRRGTWCRTLRTPCGNRCRYPAGSVRASVSCMKLTVARTAGTAAVGGGDAFTPPEGSSAAGAWPRAAGSSPHHHRCAFVCYTDPLRGNNNRAHGAQMTTLPNGHRHLAAGARAGACGRVRRARLNEGRALHMHPVSSAGLAEIARLGPGFRLRVPASALNSNPGLGQRCAFYSVLPFAAICRAGAVGRPPALVRARRQGAALAGELRRPRLRDLRASVFSSTPSGVPGVRQGGHL
jgi:hypothetical protein